MKNLLYVLMFLPVAVKAQNTAGNACSHGFSENMTIEYGLPLEWKSDTVKVVMLVSDTSSITRIRIGWCAGGDNCFDTIQDTRPFMMYGYQTSTGELLDAYKRKLGKNTVMWIAYKIK